MSRVLVLLLLAVDPARCVEVPDSCEWLIVECHPTDPRQCEEWVEGLDVEDCGEVDRIHPACGCPSGQWAEGGE